MILRADRLELRPYTPADEDDFVGLLGDESVNRWMGMPADGAAAVFRRAFLAESRPAWDIWAICEDGVYIGHAELKPSPHPAVDGHEIVYALAPSVWGRGIGSAVTVLLTEYGFGELGLDEVHATVAPENAASLKLLRRLGYVDDGEIVDPDDGEVSVLLTRKRAG
ncbi:GNAT family N-acetyltransferase [Phytomonospora sp. NPDC050363]|uniref:GNAT family N-acetyltransferase n=1 Tax=Phytomonospora sp. NPDC050363 TaxID=3155642 RepID=UPI0033F39543